MNFMAPPACLSERFKHPTYCNKTRLALTSCCKAEPRLKTKAIITWRVTVFQTRLAHSCGRMQVKGVWCDFFFSKKFEG